MEADNEAPAAKKEGLRGFAAFDEATRKKYAARGGSMVPAERRSYSLNRSLAVESGRKGGSNVDPALRSFSKNRRLAMEAGRKGGRATKRRKGNPTPATGETQ